MNIVDNFLPQADANVIHQEINSANFPWYLNSYTSYNGDGQHQLIHNIYNDDKPLSPLFFLVDPILKEFEVKTEYKIESLGRIKANFLTNRVIPSDYVEKTIHQDTDKDNYVSLLYYVEDSDGDTILFEDDKKTELMRVTPRANRAVIFKSNTWHTGLLPVMHDKRRVINFVLKVKGRAQI